MDTIMKYRTPKVERILSVLDEHRCVPGPDRKTTGAPLLHGLRYLAEKDWNLIADKIGEPIGGFTRRNLKAAWRLMEEEGDAIVISQHNGARYHRPKRVFYTTDPRPISGVQPEERVVPACGVASLWGIGRGPGRISYNVVPLFIQRARDRGYQPCQNCF